LHGFIAGLAPGVLVSPFALDATTLPEEVLSAPERAGILSREFKKNVISNQMTRGFVQITSESQEKTLICICLFWVNFEDTPSRGTW
jgi:hypothetical protein